MAYVNFYSCTQTAFKAKQTAKELVAGSLYFCTDANVIYRATSTEASSPYGEAFEVVASFPETTAARQGVLYIKSDTMEVKVFNGTALTTVAKGYTTSVAASASASDDVVPTEKAVRTAIDAIIGTSQGQVPALDANGKLSSSVLPAIALTEFKGTFASMDALTAAFSTSAQNPKVAEAGDFAIIADNATASINGTYVLTGTDATSASSWTQISTPDTDTTYEVATASANGLMSSTDFSKLAGIEEGANKYTLPTAATDTLGGVKVDGTTITISSGVISASGLEWQTLS